MRGGSPGEENPPFARDVSARRLPQPLETPVPLRVQHHCGLRVCSGLESLTKEAVGGVERLRGGDIARLEQCSLG